MDDSRKPEDKRALSPMRVSQRRAPPSLSSSSALTPMPESSPRARREATVDASARRNSLARRFDQDTHERFLGHTGGADIKSEDKEFHMDAGSRHVWAVASGGTIRKEYEALALIRHHGGATVLAGDMETVEHKGKQTEAYPMRWIRGGISSKSKSRDFAAALHEHRNSPALQESMAQLHALSEKVDIRDFQVLFDPETHQLVVNDPRGATRRENAKTTQMDSRLAEWRAHMGPSQESSGPAARRVSNAMETHTPPEPGPAIARPEPTQRDVDFHDLWRSRHVEFAPADQVHTMFSREQHAAFEANTWATDSQGNRWRFMHHSASENRVYMAPGTPSDTSQEIAAGPRLALRPQPTVPVQGASQGAQRVQKDKGE